MALFPKEHGAYGQISFPLVTAFAVAGVSWAGLLIAAATSAGFLAHEPATVLVGLRGIRARREHGAEARRWLTTCGVTGLIAAAGAVAALPADARWSLAVPLVPAFVLAVVWAKGREKSWYGELAAALAFSGAAVPVCLANGASVSIAVTVAVPFALLFVAGTLAVRLVILRVRRGGDRHAVTATRRAAFAVTVGAPAILGSATVAGYVPATLLLATVPGLLVTALVAAFPPPPARLRTLGWGLVASSVVTFGIIVTMAQR